MLLVVGRVIRPHGIRGEVVVEVRTDDPGERYAAGTVFVTDPAAAGPLTVEYARPHTTAGKQRLIVAFDEVPDRTAAETLRGVLLSAEVDELTATGPDEYHDAQLVGLAVVTPEGDELGEVVRIEHAPASELLVVRRPGAKDALVPVVKAIVAEVDLDRGRLIVTPPGGLFEL